MSSKLWTAVQVADYLQVNIQTVWDWARDGAIPSHRFGKLYRFRQDDIDCWIEKKRQRTQLQSKRILSD